MSRTLLQQAWVALTQAANNQGSFQDYKDVAEAIEQELAKPVPVPVPVPVAWLYNGHLHEVDPSDWAESKVTPLYKLPPRREWVGLTEDDCNKMIGRIQHDQYTRQRDLIGKTQIITEMYLKEKNT